LAIKIDADRIQATMSEQSGCGRQIDCLDEAPRHILAEPVRVDIWHVSATAEHH